jgi:uncharacterized Zn finger protein
MVYRKVIIICKKCGSEIIVETDMRGKFKVKCKFCGLVSKEPDNKIST